jgi:hypothetical protein
VEIDNSSVCAPRTPRSLGPVIDGPDICPTILQAMQARDVLAAVSMATPCHSTVTADGADLTFGRVLDAVVPLAPDSLRAAREHRIAGGVVRLHARRLCDLDTARADLIRA